MRIFLSFLNSELCPCITPRPKLPPFTLPLSMFVLQVQVHCYLKSLPIPSSTAGFAELTRDQWLQLVPFILFLFVILYLLLSPFLGVLTQRKERRPKVNRRQRLNEQKVVDNFDMEDLDKRMKEKDGKVSFCRCWKSSKVCFCRREYVVLLACQL